MIIIDADKLAEIIVGAIDASTNKVECQTLRWVLDKISELSSVTPQPTDAASRDVTNEGRWREEEEYSYGLKSKRIWLEPIQALKQQPKTGKWIRSWCEWQQYLKCSKCGYETGLRCDTNYCPNCGAYMEESEGEI